MNQRTVLSSVYNNLFQLMNKLKKNVNKRYLAKITQSMPLI